MADERIVTTEAPEGTHTHTTIVTEGSSSRRSGGFALPAVIALLVIAGLLVWAFAGMSGSEVAKDNAIADAAGEIGNAAGQIGDAAQDAADSVN